MMNMASYFSDPDGDPLTYSAVSSNAGVVTTSASGSTVTFTPMSAGAASATGTVTAMDPGGLTATQSVAVTVEEPVDPLPRSQNESDLTVSRVSVTTSPSGTPPGGSFRLSATVRNDGDASSAATTLRYYRSTDATVTTSDTEVGTDVVEGLAASATSRESIGLPAAAGTYYYGACVDAVAGESATTNNCSGSVQVTVSEPEPPPPPPQQTSPDLTVASPSVNDNSPAPRNGFRLSATVRNDGDASSAATTLRYYRSTDATVTTSDTEVGTDVVEGLAASATSRKSIGLTAPAAAGTYYYGACVDVVAGESATTNNCSGSVQVMVSEQGDGGQPATEVHLFRPDQVEERARTHPLVVVAWTTSNLPPTESIPVRVWPGFGHCRRGGLISVAPPNR